MKLFDLEQFNEGQCLAARMALNNLMINLCRKDGFDIKALETVHDEVKKLKATIEKDKRVRTV